MMRRTRRPALLLPALLWALSLALSGCVAPEPGPEPVSGMKAGQMADTSDAAPEPVAEAPVLMAPLPRPCDEDGDGIGGTGCPVR